MIITLNRPEVRNAIDTETAWAISNALDTLDADPTLAAAVLTGAGATFCAGMDLKAFLAGEKPSVGARGFAGIVEKPPLKPIIAAVEGTALAGGLRDRARLRPDRGCRGRPLRPARGQAVLVAGGGGLMRLARRVPFHLAMEWALTGDFISAGAAATAGLVNRLVPSGTALDEALTLARGDRPQRPPCARRNRRSTKVSARSRPIRAPTRRAWQGRAPRIACRRA